MGAVVNGIDPGAGAIRGAELAFGGAGGAVPKDQVAVLFLGQHTHYVLIKVETHDASEAQGFIERELRRLKGIPGQHEPLGERIELSAARAGSELLHPPGPSPHGEQHQERLQG